MDLDEWDTFRSAKELMHTHDIKLMLISESLYVFMNTIGTHNLDLDFSYTDYRDSHYWEL